MRVFAVHTSVIICLAIVVLVAIPPCVAPPSIRIGKHRNRARNRWPLSLKISTPPSGENGGTILDGVSARGDVNITAQNGASKKPPPQLHLFLWKRLSVITSTEEFFQLMVVSGKNRRNGTARQLPAEKKPIVETVTTSDTSSIRTGKPKNLVDTVLGDDFAKPVNCAPRLSIVEIPRIADHSLVLWPFCTELERCSGGCSHELFTCKPSRVETVMKKVMRARYPHPGAEMFNYEGIDSVRLERHLECEYGCKVTADMCNERQVHENCQCRCMNSSDITSCTQMGKSWDNNQCKCL